MAFTQISGDALQYIQDNIAAVDSYIKLYAAGTTTPISMATDNTGGTLLTKAKIDSQGRAVNGSDAPFVPHIDQVYRIVLYPDATTADANAFGSALYDIDNLDQFAIDSKLEVYAVNFPTIALAKADAVGLLAANIGGFARVAEFSGGLSTDDLFEIVTSGTGTDDGGSFHDSDAALAYQLQLMRKDVISSASFGLVGTSDDTAIFQNMLDFCEGKSLYIRNPGNVIHISQVVIPSNIDIFIEPGTVIEDNGDIEGTLDKLFRIFRVINVRIVGYGATLQGLGSGNYTGEQNHGLYIVGCQRVYVAGLTVSATGGDGFYVGSSGGTGDQLLTEDVALVDCDGQANRRQGLTINSAKNCLIDRFGGDITDGTAPQAGIDIEPDSNEEFLINIVIRDSNTGGNSGSGITVGIRALAGAVDKTVSITIENHRDVGSTNSYAIAAFNGTLGNIKGRITYKDCKASDSINGSFAVRNFGSDGPLIEIIRPHVHNNATSGGIAPKSHSPFSVFREVGDVGSAKIGNVRIIDPLITIDETDVTPQTIAAFHVNDLTTTTPADEAEKVFIIDPIEIGGIDPNVAVDFVGSGTITDSYDLLRRSENSNVTLSPTSYVRTLDNEAETDSNQLVTLADNFSPGSPDITFENKQDGNDLIIDPDVLSTIVPFGTGAGKRLSSTQIGNKITLRRTSATQWNVIDVVGTWVAEA